MIYKIRAIIVSPIDFVRGNIPDCFNFEEECQNWLEVQDWRKIIKEEIWLVYEVFEIFDDACQTARSGGKMLNMLYDDLVKKLSEVNWVGGRWI